MGRPVCGFASRFRDRFGSRPWRPLLRVCTSPRQAGSAEQTLAWAGAGGPGRWAARSTRSHEEVGSLSLLVTTDVGEKPDEHYWWEDHVPTRLYLAQTRCSSAGHERQD